MRAREKDVMNARWIVVATALAAMLLGVMPDISPAQEKFDLNPSFGIKDILAAHVGKRVAVRLGSGSEIEGTVAKVGDHFVHISKLTGKDFYDSIVRIDHIDAVTYRAR
jgi:hypothetical protein